MQAVLPKRPINQLKPVQQSRQQALGAYCLNIYTVPYFIVTQFRGDFQLLLSGNGSREVKSEIQILLWILVLP